MLYVLFGSDDYSLRRELSGIKNSIGDAGCGDANSTVFDGSKVKPDELAAAAVTVPFLAEKRLIIVEGLLARLSPGRQKNPAPKPARHAAGKKDEPTRFLAALTSLPETTLLVLVEGDLKPANALLKKLVGKAEIKQFPELRAGYLVNWIKKQVTASGGAITQGAATRLSQLVGGNLWAMYGEVEKLTLYAAGRPVTEDDVVRLTSDAREDSIFALLDAVLAASPQQAQTLLESRLQDGETPTNITFRLHHQLALLVRLVEMKKRRLPRGEMMKNLGQYNDWVFNKLETQAARYPLPRLKHAYRLLLETERAIKTGKYEAELAVNILVADMVK
jgi:DNA polymerase III subunit delta